QEGAVRREGVTASLDAMEARLNEQKLALLELERELSTAQGGLRDREEARRGAEHQVVLLRERAAGLERRGTEAGEEAAAMRERLAEAGRNESESAEQRGEARGERETAQKAAEAREAELAAVEAELRERRSVVADKKQLSLDLFSTEAEKRGACERIREREKLLRERLEASRGEAAAFVLVDGGQAMEAALERLRAMESGRATLVDLRMLASGALPVFPRETGVIGRASDLVRCEDRYRPLVERLLGGVVVVEDRPAAARLAARAEGGLRFVTLDGEVWERGRVRAGSARNLRGLLHREMEIREL